MSFKNNENKIKMIDRLPVYTLKDKRRLLIVSSERELKFYGGTSIEDKIDDEIRESTGIHRSYSETGSKESKKGQGINDNF